MTDYIIGIDAGGSQTSAIAYTRQGIVLGKAEGAFGNPLVHRMQAVRNIVHTTYACAPEEGTCLLVYVGVAGGEGSFLQKTLPIEIEQGLRQMGMQTIVRVTSDATLGLEAHMGNEDGILLIAGTGSIAYGQKDGQIMRVGGWGNILGDQGSGYDIAKQAIIHMLNEVDEGLSESDFSRSIRQSLHCATPRDCVDAFHQMDKGDCSTLSMMVDTLARQGDAIALTLMKKAGRDLADMVMLLHKRMQLQASFSLATVGGVVHHGMGIKQSLQVHLCANGLKPQFLPDKPPQWAVVQLYNSQYAGSEVCG